MMAAAAIMPIVPGRILFRMDANQGLFLNLSKRMQIHSTSRYEGRTTAMVAVSEPSTLMAGLNPMAWGTE